MKRTLRYVCGIDNGLFHVSSMISLTRRPMLIGQVVQPPIILPQNIVFFLEIIYCLSLVSDVPPCLILVLRLNIAGVANVVAEVA